MCRWNAYIGQPLLIDELLYRTQHGPIDESLHARMGAETTNGDGFGLGWYPTGMPTDPARYRSVNPARNDANLRDLTRHIESCRGGGRRWPIAVALAPSRLDEIARPGPRRRRHPRPDGPQFASVTWMFA